MDEDLYPFEIYLCLKYFTSVFLKKSEVKYIPYCYQFLELLFSNRFNGCH